MKLTKRERELLERAKRGEAPFGFVKAFEALTAAPPADPDVATFVLARRRFRQPFAPLYAAVLVTFAYRKARRLPTSPRVMEREVRHFKAILENSRKAQA